MREPSDLVTTALAAAAFAAAILLSPGGARALSLNDEPQADDLQAAVPKEMGGQGGKTNPEELFATGYTPRFHSAVKRVAADRKLAIGKSTVETHVGLGPNGNGPDLVLFVGSEGHMTICDSVGHCEICLRGRRHTQELEGCCFQRELLADARHKPPRECHRRRRGGSPRDLPFRGFAVIGGSTPCGAGRERAWWPSRATGAAW